jgi:hypothetical protein
MEMIVNKMVLTALNEIINYRGPGSLTPKAIARITDIEKQTPLAFQQRFFLLMDIIEPCMDYARLFIKHKHPDMLYLFNWLCKLYVDEAEISSSPKSNNEVD